MSDRPTVEELETQSRIKAMQDHNQELLDALYEKDRRIAELTKQVDAMAERITVQTAAVQTVSEIMSRAERAAGTKITEHEGKKYLREIFGATEEVRYVEAGGRKIPAIKVDVYCVLAAFRVESSPIAHAVKKCLAAGERGKGDVLADLNGVLAAINRAVEMQKLKEADQ